MECEIEIGEDTRMMLNKLKMTASRVYTYDEIIKLLIAHKLCKDVKGEISSLT